MALKTKSLDFNIKSSDEAGTFTAYGNTFGNVDHAGEKTMPGAFAKCIQGWNAKSRMPRLLSQHGHRQNPIGVITSMKEDENGLLFEGKFCTEPGTAGAEAYALVKMGALDQFSIGYNIVDSKMDGNVKELHELDVKEISLVTFACNENSLIQSVKSAIETGDITTRMIQDSLRQFGLSKRQAEDAIHTIKNTGQKEQEEATAIDNFKTEAEAHVLDTKFIEGSQGDMSIGEYSCMIRGAVESTIKADYAYVEYIYMKYVIACICDDDEDGNYTRKYVRINYTVDGTDVLVGSAVEVTKDVQWLSEAERQARVQAGVKSEEVEVSDDVPAVTETLIKSDDVKGWFK